MLFTLSPGREPRGKGGGENREERTRVYDARAHARSVFKFRRVFINKRLRGFQHRAHLHNPPPPAAASCLAPRISAGRLRNTIATMAAYWDEHCSLQSRSGRPRTRWPRTASPVSPASPFLRPTPPPQQPPPRDRICISETTARPNTRRGTIALF